MLTPSCDLVTTKDRKPKVENVLVAKCITVKQALEQANFGKLSQKDLAEKIRSEILSQGYLRSILPLPQLAHIIPEMFADLRSLELLPLDKSTGTIIGYKRVASLDSPFRELVSWAYLQISARPGLPDRDISRWATEMASGASA